MAKFNFTSAISPYVKALPDSGLGKFMEMTADNPDIISLSVGEPNFDVPPKVREATIESIKNGHSNYTSTLGMFELRSAISKDIERNYGVKYNPRSEILVTVGVSEALFTVIRTLVGDGDEVILPEPCYISNKACIILAGGTPVPVETYMEDGFIPTIAALEKAVTPKTKAIMFGYPNNPTGAIMSKEQIKNIGDWAVKHNLIVISDELYAHLTYGGHKHHIFTCFPEFRDRTIVLNGFSKAYAMTGLRLGYILAPKELIKAANDVHQQLVLCPPVTSQYGAIAALRYCEPDMLDMMAHYDKRRKIMIDGIKKIGLPLYAPEGAFYIFPCIKQTGLTSIEFVEKLLKEENVLVLPGHIFGAGGEGYVRLSYAYSEETLHKALEHLARFIKKYTKK